jgi:hypothetical protein
MSIPEKPLNGGEEICTFLGWSQSKLYRKLPELKGNAVVWYEWHGRPPRRYLSSYPSLLIDYKRGKALKGEIL